MKKIFLFLFILISAVSSAQDVVPYNPSRFTVSNKPYGPAQAFSTDARSMYFDPANQVFRAYVSTAEVLGYLNNPKYRVGAFDILVNTGGELNSGVITGGTNAIWYFKNCTDDTCLVLKIPEASSVNARAPIVKNGDSIYLDYDTNSVSVDDGKLSLIINQDSGASQFNISGNVYIQATREWVRDNFLNSVKTKAPITYTNDSVELNIDTNAVAIVEDNLSTKVPVLSSIEALRDLPAAAVSSSFIYEVMGTQAGRFRYDPDETGNDDSAMIIENENGDKLVREVDQYVYPEWFGAVGDGVTDDSDAFNRMFRWMEQNAKNFKIVGHKNTNYLLNDTIFLPGVMQTGSTSGVRIKIDGMGVTYKKTNTGPLLSRMPASQSEALNQLIDNHYLTISGLKILGNLTDGQTGLAYGAAYKFILEGCHFQLLDTAVVAAFWLNGTISDCFFTRNKSVSIKGTSGYLYWPSGSNENSAFNANSIINNRVNNANGSYAGIMLFAADGTKLNGHISEGFNPRYDIYIDSRNVTVVNGNRYENIWFESNGGVYTNNTCFYLRDKNAYISTFQNDYQDTLIDVRDMTTGSVVTIENIQFIATGPAGADIFTSNANTISGSKLTILSTESNYSDVFMDTTKWYGGTIGFAEVNVVRGANILSTGAVNLSPAYNNGQNSRRINIRGGITFDSDNVYPIGFPNKTKGIAVGTDGAMVDKSSGTGFGFGNYSVTPVNRYLYVNDSVARFNNTGAIRLPIGTTAQRPPTTAGNLRYNSTISMYEYANGLAWLPIADTGWVDTYFVRKTAITDSLNVIRDTLGDHWDYISNLYDSIGVLRDSINALRADIGGGGGGALSSVSNGLTEFTGDGQLGGALTKNTNITGNYNLQLGTGGSALALLGVHADRVSVSGRTRFLVEVYSDEDVTLDDNETCFSLNGNLTNNRTVTFPTDGMDIGEILILVNGNTNATYDWNVSGPVKSKDGSSLSVLGDDTSYIFVYVGSYWREL